MKLILSDKRNNMGSAQSNNRRVSYGHFFNLKALKKAL